MVDTGEPIPMMREPDWQAHQFENKLREMVRLPLPYEKFPLRLDVGDAWDRRMFDLWDETIRDKEQRERSRVAILRSDGRIDYSVTTTVGTQTSVNFDYDLKRRQTQRIINGQIHTYDEIDQLLVTLHSHGHFGGPPSPPDFYNVILEGSQPNAAVMAVILTPGLRLALFRSLETDDLQLTPEKATSNTRRWTDQVKTIMNLRSHGATTTSEYIRAQFQANMGEILKIAKLTKVRLYSSSQGSVFTKFE